MIPFFLMIHTIISPVATMRDEPDQSSRVASQAIFSEEVRVLEEQGDWVKIETIIDSYQGWIKKETCAAVEKLPKKTVMIDRIAAHLYHVTDTEFGPIMTLPFESRLELIEELPDSDRRWLKVKLPNNKEAFVQRGDCLLIPQKLTREQMVAFSKYFLGLPYTWGGRSSFGYDCSAFVQMLYRQMGVYIPRDSKDQIKWDGFQSIEMNELQPGDLIFWGKSAQKINHVGMYLGEGKFIHTIASVEKKPYLRISSVNDPAWDAKPTNYHAFRAAKTLKG